MLVTILEAQVAADRWQILEEAYRTGILKLDPGIVQTFLLHSAADANTWRIFTLWASRDALNAMRNSGETPRGVLMFREAGAEPALSIHEVTASAVAAAAGTAS